jgi:hypothetical protein
MVIEFFKSRFSELVELFIDISDISESVDKLEGPGFNSMSPLSSITAIAQCIVVENRRIMKCKVESKRLLFILCGFLRHLGEYG